MNIDVPYDDGDFEITINRADEVMIRKTGDEKWQVIPPLTLWRIIQRGLKDDWLAHWFVTPEISEVIFVEDERARGRSWT